MSYAAASDDRPGARLHALIHELGLDRVNALWTGRTAYATTGGDDRGSSPPQPSGGQSSRGGPRLRGERRAPRTPRHRSDYVLLPDDEREALDWIEEERRGGGAR